jgi:hypothetical protein
MKVYKKLYLLAIVVYALSTTAYAEERVIEDSLVYNDPTVAKGDQLIMGVSADYFTYTQSRSLLGGNITNQFSQPGITGFAGKGNFSASLSYRSGTEQVSGSFPIPGYSPAMITVTGTAKSNSSEIMLRWLARDWATKYFTPYAAVIYISSAADNSLTFVSGGTTYNYSYTSKATIQGAIVGGIFPVSATYGFRAEAGRGYGNQTVDSQSSTFAGTRYIATMYYNVTKAWNAQLGYKRYVIDGGGNETGYYAMLGYTMR